MQKEKLSNKKNRLVTTFEYKRSDYRHQVNIYAAQGKATRTARPPIFASLSSIRA